MNNLSFIPLLFFSVLSFAQSDYITSMTVIQTGEQLVIEYELENQSVKNYYYEVEMQLLYDNGLVYPSPALIKGIYSIEGKKHLEPGNNRIVWDILNEPSVKDIIGEIEVTLKASLFADIPDGPKRALTSLVVPGLGQYYVHEQKKPYFLITTASYGTVGTGILYRIKYRKTYDEYLTARDQAQINLLSDQYQKELGVSNSLLIIGGVIWGVDILTTALKGRKNNIKYANLYSATTNTESWHLGLAYIDVFDTPTVGLGLTVQF